MIEMSGRMDNVKPIADGKGKKFGLRISTRVEKGGEDWHTGWIDVVVWDDCDGFELVGPHNEKEKVTILDAYPRAREWQTKDGTKVNQVEWTCSKLRLGWGASDGPEPTSVDDEEMPF